jgi:uncharacterized protein YgiB involved in biofilm formation
MRSRRSTATLTLVLIGAAALGGCGGNDEEKAARDVYRTKADCQRDWGDDDKKCEAVTSGGHAGMFYGPLLLGTAAGYAAGRGLAPRPGSSAVATTTTTVSRSGASSGASSSVSRGGFGSSASSHSSGG